VLGNLTVPPGKTQLLPSFLTVDDAKKLNNFGTQNGPSTHVIDATSCVEMWSTTIQAEELSYILSYQTYSMDKNLKDSLEHYGSAQSDGGNLFGRGWARALCLGLVLNLKIMA
jgi:hypothetical protein